jgi:GNAT superfamily N-acetyltransferase
MTDLSNTFAKRPCADTFRNAARPRDISDVEDLVRKTGVFNAAEIAIARELVEECLEKGPARSGYHFLFADGEAGLEGYVCLGPIVATDARFELYWIAVDPGIRRSGLGRCLQTAAEAEARTLGARYLIAQTSTTPAYETARNFYRSMGYEHLGDVAKWFSDIDGLAVFGKQLTD